MKVLRILVAIVVLVLVGGVSAQVFTNLYSFTGGSDGGSLYAGLVQGSDGDFYGTTRLGGDTNLHNGLVGYGTVFRITPSGTLSNLHSFSGSTGDGAYPEAPLTQGADGFLYGTTANGGTSTNCGIGCGTVFKISTSGSLTTLYSFSGTDGTHPNGLVQGTDGGFYGTTQGGGDHKQGTVFRISTSGALTTLWSFCTYTSGSTCLDGQQPRAGLVVGSDGNLYGTTEGGGALPFAFGTVFKFAPGGSLTTLYSFSGGSDGHDPQAPLVQYSDGNLYSTTAFGGTNHDAPGNVFRISPTGAFTNVCSFDPVDGGYPLAGIIQGSDGSLYGMTVTDGAFVQGTLFRVSSSGNLTSLYSFTGGTDGHGSSTATLVQGSDGNFYGTSRSGGTYSNGTVFRLTLPLNPPANRISAVQIIGNDICFSVPSVAGETYQLQFSSSMIPTNWVNISGASVTNSIGALLTVTNFGGAVGPQGFYRFDITP